ncbi:hypothetical protein, partial [Streptomyces albidoflavus]|uniref:hypothetical protein n=1 Tax=Streptomyces albidoflavus TaxID=1886 RepID=UPI001596604B
MVRRRSEFRRGKKRDRLHLVEGLLVALVDIDEGCTCCAGGCGGAWGRGSVCCTPAAAPTCAPPP